MADQFNLQGYLKSEGYNFVGGTDKEGVIKVVGPDGNTGQLDVHGLLKSEGIGSDVSVLYNTPDTAVDSSPVGFADRVALGLGNAKGQLDYLKHNYQDAQLNGEGDVMVKDKGIWHRVDARGLGSGDGWDMAKELAGDGADLIKDGILAAGGMMGAASGAAGGLFAFGAGAVPGAILGSGAGTAAASTLTMALGRIVNTYQADTIDTIKDVGFDAMLGLTGEGIAAGAKHTVVPKLASMLANFAGDSTSAGVKNTIARGITTLTNGTVSSESAARAVSNPEVSQLYKQFYDDSLKLGIDTSKHEGPKPLFDNAIKSTMMPGSDDAVLEVARKSMLPDASYILQGAQKRLSANYVAGVEKVAAQAADDLVVNSAAPIADALQGVVTDFPDMFKMRYGSDGAFLGYAVKDASLIADSLKVAEPIALNIKKGLQAWADHSHRMITGTESTVGPDGVRSLFENYRLVNEFYADVVEGTTIDGGSRIGDIIAKPLGGLKDKISQAAGPDLQQHIAKVGQDYFRNKQAVKMAESATNQGQKGIEGILNKMSNPVDRDVTTRENMRILAALAGDTGNTAHEAILNKVAAADLVRTTAPKMAGGGIPTRIVTGAVGSLAPKVINPTVTGLGMMGRTLRSMSGKTRSLLLKDEKALSALFTTALGQGYDPTEAAASQANMYNQTTSGGQ